VSNDQSGGNTGSTGATDSASNEGLDPEVQEALRRPGPIDDPNLGGSTTSSWSGDAGPDPGGIVGPSGENGEGS